MNLRRTTVLSLQSLALPSSSSSSTSSLPELPLVPGAEDVNVLPRTTKLAIAGVFLVPWPDAVAALMIMLLGEETAADGVRLLLNALQVGGELSMQPLSLLQL